jgi:hypothetical protein
MKKPSKLLSLNHLLLVSLSLLLVAGCSSVKRHRSAEWKGHDHTLVDMDLFGASLEQPAGPAAGRNLWDLSASAQAELVQILDERYPDNEQFMGALSTGYLTEASLPALNVTNKNLRMVFTISRQRDYQALNEFSGRFSQADRIEYLKFSLELPQESGLHFKQWNRFTTEYGEVEIADVSFSTSLDLDADGVIQQTDAGVKTSFSRNEQQELKSRYLKLNGSMDDHRISMEEEGTREIDLTGNVIADVSLGFDGFPERVAIPVFSGTGKHIGESAAPSSFRFVDVLVPRMEEIANTIQGVLSLEYVYRHVQSGSRTFAEWDDQVEYYTGKVQKQVPLFTKRDYLPGFYCIAELQGEGEPLKIKQGKDREYLLQFVNYQDAFRILEWLEGLGSGDQEDRKGPLIVGTSTLFFRGEALTGTEAAALHWKVQPVY